MPPETKAPGQAGAGGCGWRSPPPSAPHPTAVRGSSDGQRGVSGSPAVTEPGLAPPRDAKCRNDEGSAAVGRGVTYWRSGQYQRPALPLTVTAVPIASSGSGRRGVSDVIDRKSCGRSSTAGGIGRQGGVPCRQARSKTLVWTNARDSRRLGSAEELQVRGSGIALQRGQRPVSSPTEAVSSQAPEGEEEHVVKEGDKTDDRHNTCAPAQPSSGQTQVSTPPLQERQSDSSSEWSPEVSSCTAAGTDADVGVPSPYPSEHLHPVKDTPPRRGCSQFQAQVQLKAQGRSKSAPPATGRREESQTANQTEGEEGEGPAVGQQPTANDKRKRSAKPGVSNGKGRKKASHTRPQGTVVGAGDQEKKGGRRGKRDPGPRQVTPQARDKSIEKTSQHETIAPSQSEHANHRSSPEIAGTSDLKETTDKSVQAVPKVFELLFKMAAEAMESPPLPSAAAEVEVAVKVENSEPVVTLEAANREELVEKVWREYVEEFLINSNHVTQAAIFDRESGQELAGSSGFKLQEGEFSQILEAMVCPNLAHRRGVTVDGHHYQVRLADGKFGIFARTGRSGCSVCQTFSLLIVGVHDGSGKPERCNEEVMRLGDFFRKKGL